jgi:branched-subunit amino acid transport protein
MDSTMLWAIILGGMLMTYATRLSFIALIPHEKMPALFLRSLRYVPPAVLAALIAPELLFIAGDLQISLSNYRLLAGFVASMVVWRTKNTWFTITAGMGTLWLLSLL